LEKAAKMVKLLSSVITLVNCVVTLASALPHENEARQVNWPDGPWLTSGRNIVTKSGKNVTYAGVNWPGAGETMLPEGLQYQSIATIVSKIKSIGINAIRLTYAIEMIDQIYDNGGKDINVQTAFAKGLGAANGTTILNQFLTKNPSFTASTTRLQVRNLPFVRDH
jgi:hypothetical protein